MRSSSFFTFITCLISPYALSQTPGVFGCLSSLQQLLSCVVIHSADQSIFLFSVILLFVSEEKQSKRKKGAFNPSVIVRAETLCRCRSHIF